MNKTTNKYTPEVRERAVRMVLIGEGQSETRWAVIVSISSNIDCAPQMPIECVKKVELTLVSVAASRRKWLRRLHNRALRLSFSIADMWCLHRR